MSFQFGRLVLGHDFAVSYCQLWTIF